MSITMGVRKEARQRPQYHYFYGSTDEPPNSPQLSAAQSDVLIGESLVPTDTEEEIATPKTSARDLRQLVLSNGKATKSSLGIYELGESEPLVTQNGNHGTAAAAAQVKKSWFESCLESVLNIRGSHPVGHVARVFVLVAMMLLMCTLVMVLKPKASTSTTGSVKRWGSTPSLHIPYPIVDRAEYDDPASKIIDEALFDPSLLFNAGKKVKGKKGTLLRSSTPVDPVLKVPFPTGAFWVNLVLNPQSDGFSYPIVSYPYAFKWSASVLQASYPVIRRKITKLSIQDVFEPDVSFGSHEEISKRLITRFDPLSVTLRFDTTGSGYWESYIVHGSPYITIKYNQASPVLKALSTFVNVMCPFGEDGNYYDGNEEAMIDGTHSRKLKWDVCTPSDGSGDGGVSILHGVQFLIQTQENMTWILFASEVIELSFDTRIRTEILASKFSGVLRLALIPPTGTLETKDSNATTELVRLSESSGLRRLVYHAQVYPVAGSVTWSFKAATTSPTIAQTALKAITGTETLATVSSTTQDKGRIGSVHFTFETKPLNQLANTNNDIPLLSLGLPHHADVLSAASMLSTNTFDLDYWCIKGQMTPILGSTWTYDEKLTETTFERNPDLKFDADVAKLILENIKTDMKMYYPHESLSIYAYAKQAGRLAQLAHIARVVTKRSNATSAIMEEITSKLHDCLSALLEGKISDELLYDAKFGGVVSKNGLMNINEDFGNGRYNDHHFHYGYILYAASVMGNLNSSFVDEYGDEVDTLMYDIAYKANGDSLTVDKVFFPLSRHKSWFDGHSFAAGLFPAANGKSQESTSEAVNGYYGAYLWSLVKYSHTYSDAALDFKDYMRLLLATEIRGAKTYWHMMPPQNGTTSNITYARLNVYPAFFTENYMVGNLGMLDAVSSTYFAKELFYVHLINILPITAITPELFGKDYVDQQYSHILAKTEIPNAWKGYAVCNQAIGDPNIAWNAALKLVSVELDPGLSKSQVLYFISTLPGFQTPSSVETGSADESGNDISPASSSSDAASCLAYVKCSPLTGFCCPTSDGIMLECCE